MQSLPSVPSRHNPGNSGDYSGNIRVDSNTGRYPSKQQQEETLDLHELAKGWKAAVARATDASTR
jgi:hypothetical protein